MVPHVASAEEARHVVDMVRCHPLGRRAMDGGNMDGAFCQIPLADYAHQNNNERFVILQIESPEALEQVEAIAAVPGFDMLLFGAGDFSLEKLERAVSLSMEKYCSVSHMLRGSVAFTTTCELSDGPAGSPASE